MSEPDPPIALPGADVLKAEVHHTWAAKGAAWDRRADDLADRAERFNQPLIEAARIEPGQRVLDLASGAGEPALSIARLVGDGGLVTATDLVPEMLAGARRRAAEAGLANIRFEIADMEALPFGDGAFDRVVCRFGVMFAPRADAAFAEARRVLVAGGRVAYVVFGPCADNTMFEVMRTVVPGFIADSPFNGELTPFRFGAVGALGGALEAAGFNHVEEREIRFDSTAPVGRGFWRANLEMSFGAALEALSADRRAALDGALEDAFATYLDGDVYRLASHIRVAAGVA